MSHFTRNSVPVIAFRLPADCVSGFQKIQVRAKMPRRRMFRRKFRRRSKRFTRFRRKRRAAIVNRPELKVEDDVQAALNCSLSNAPIVRGLDLDQGIGSGQRIGNGVRVMSISVRFHMAMDQGAVQNEVWHRVAVFVDKQTIVGQLPFMADIYEDGVDPQSFREKATAGRFRQLFAKTFMLDKRDRQTRVITMFFKFPRGLVIRYAGSGGAQWQKNIIVLCGQADVPIATPSVMNILNRVRYFDA